MKKPKTIEIGQIWSWKYDEPFDVNWKVVRFSLDGLSAICEVIKSNKPNILVASSNKFRISGFLINSNWLIISDGRNKSNRKRPQLFIVICRGCGSKNDWVKGTSKKNYLCLPCRKEL